MPASFYVNQKLVIDDTLYTMNAESVDKGFVKTIGNKLDIWGRDGVNAGKHFTGIYKREKGELTVCYNLAGDSYPESFSTEGKSLYFLSVFKRE